MCRYLDVKPEEADWDELKVADGAGPGALGLALRPPLKLRLRRLFDDLGLWLDHLGLVAFDHLLPVAFLVRAEIHFRGKFDGSVFVDNFDACERKKSWSLHNQDFSLLCSSLMKILSNIFNGETNKQAQLLTGFEPKPIWFYLISTTISVHK